MRDDYRIEEADDERTFGDELVQDCDKQPFVEAEEEFSLPVLEYLGEFKALIDACGQVSYFWNMERFVSAEVNKAKNIASAYHHDLHYYQDQLREWQVKATRSFDVLSFHASKFGYVMPAKISCLNALTLSEDRRDAYKGYLATCVKKMTTISPQELEKKFAQRFRKRLERAQKK